jgi:hypothetical protein
VRFGDLALFAAGGCFGNGSGLGSACRFDAFCGCGAGGILSVVQRAAHGGVGVFCLMSAGGLCCVTRGGLCSSGGGFSFGLCQQRLLTDLLGGAMP